MTLILHRRKSRKAELKYPDIYNYLIAYMLSLYTKDKLKAYKYFLNGWISNVTVYSVPSGAIQLLAQYVFKQGILMSSFDTNMFAEYVQRMQCGILWFLSVRDLI